MPRDAVARMVEDYVGEALAGIALLEDGLPATGARLLEVGSGAGLLVRFFRSEGFDVVGIEPAIAEGFGFMHSLDRAVGRQVNGVAEPIGHPATAGSLHDAELDRFDLVYSLNVIEHVADLPRAFTGMARVLAPAGRIIHVCPSYRVPYEPHFGLPLVPAAPSLTRRLFARRIDARADLWDSLNFVTAGRLRTIAAREGLDVTFRPGVMASTFARLGTDPAFRRRHGALSALAGSRVTADAIEATLRRLPAAWQSPMIAELRFATTPCATC